MAQSFRSARTVVVCAVVVLITMTLGCRRDVITREQWMSKTRDQKELIVRSMIGGEKAAEAKGGNGAKYTDNPFHYIDEIDRHYRSGDKRSVNEIWEELKD